MVSVDESSTCNEKNDSETKEFDYDKIVKQLEYYFSDYNYCQDKFLQTVINDCEEGWVPTVTLLKFKILNSLTSGNEEAIFDSLRIKSSNFFESDLDKKCIRRSINFPYPKDIEEGQKVFLSKTVYVKGFPKNTSFIDLQTFFLEFGPVLNVYMRRMPHNKAFKGSVFVTFENEDDFKKVLTTEKLSYKSHSLIVMSKESFQIQKDAEIKNKKDALEIKNEAKKANQEKLQEEVDKIFTPGNVIHFYGLTPSKITITREDFKELFDDFGEIGWITYAKGSEEGYIRFVKADNVAIKALKNLTGEENIEAGKEYKINIKSLEINVVILFGEEEKKFYLEEVKNRHESNQNKKRKRGNRRNDSWQTRKKANIEKEEDGNSK